MAAAAAAGVAAELLRLAFSLAGPLRASGLSASSLLALSEQWETLVVGFAQEGTQAFCS